MCFNNDVNGYAVYDAERLRIRVEGPVALGGREPMTKPEEQLNQAAYPPYPARHGRRVRRPAQRSSRNTAFPEETH